MKTNNETGRTIGIVVGVWLIVKVFLNFLIGGISLSGLGGSFLEMAFSVAALVIMYIGLKYTNYVIAGIIALRVFWYLPGNIGALLSFEAVPSHLIYIAEGLIDLAFAIALCISQSVKEHFSNLPSDISQK